MRATQFSDENGDPVPETLWNRYVFYMGSLLQGDLGSSYQRKLPVTDIFAAKYPYTAKLALCAIVLEAIMGIGAGIISAVKRYSFWDILVTLVTSVLVAVPAFWLGMLLQLFFGVQLHVLPISGAGGTAFSVSGLGALHPSCGDARFRFHRILRAYHALAAPGRYEPGLHPHR